MRKIVIHNIRSHDVMGTREDIAYGEGYHAQRKDSCPYTDVPLRAAWERGRQAAKNKVKVVENYFKGEERGRRFIRPQVKDGGAGSGPNPGKGGVFSRTSAQQFGKLNNEARQRKLNSEGKKPVEEEIDDFVKSMGGSKDFKSERGYQAKIFSSTGGVVATSQPYLNEAAANKWLQKKIEAVIKLGHRVSGKVFPGFFDPYLLQGA